MDRIYAFTLTIALSEVTFSELAGLASYACAKTSRRPPPAPKQRVAAAAAAESHNFSSRLTFTSLCFLPKAIPASRFGGRDYLVLIIESTNWSSLRGSGSPPKYNR